VTGGAFGVLTGIAFFRVGAARDGLPISGVADLSRHRFGALVVLWFGNTLLAKR